MAGKATISASSSGALQERYGDWTLTIINQAAADRARPSYAISYTLYDLQTNKPALSIELTPERGSLRAMLALPPGLYLRRVELPQDSNVTQGLAKPFSAAFPRACLVELNLNKATLVSLRRRRSLRVTAAAADTGRDTSYVISLNGFAEALNRALSIIDPYVARNDVRSGVTLQ